MITENELEAVKGDAEDDGTFEGDVDDFADRAKLLAWVLRDDTFGAMAVCIPEPDWEGGRFYVCRKHHLHLSTEAFAAFAAFAALPPKVKDSHLN